MLPNSKLKNMFKLGCKVTIYVPATININEEIDNSAYVDRAATLLSECFGGATSTKALGYWVSPIAGLTKEKTTMVFAYCTSEQLDEYSDKVVSFCIDLCKELSQDAIALEINGEMYFIDAE